MIPPSRTAAITLVPKARDRPAWGVGASLLLHGLFVALVLAAWTPRQLAVQQQRAIEVELVSPPPARPAAPGQAGTEPAVPDTGAGSTPAPAVASPPRQGLVEASRYYAADMLRQPDMGKIRRTLGTLADSERIVQLCNIEGLEQIRNAGKGYDPDVVVSYAMKETRLMGMTLVSDGGAFRSRRRWFGVRFRCTVAADYSGVEDFAFAIGDAIPEDEWEAHDLTAEDSDE
jgi:hypothetical protein